MRRRRAILVGAGGMGRNWASNLLACEEVELVAWVDLRREVAVAAAAALGLDEAVVAGSLAEALDSTEADFVVDVSVPEAHHAVTLEQALPCRPGRLSEPDRRTARCIGHPRCRLLSRAALRRFP
jgi:predicted dehydrogenase